MGFQVGRLAVFHIGNLQSLNVAVRFSHFPCRRSAALGPAPCGGMSGRRALRRRRPARRPAGEPRAGRGRSAGSAARSSGVQSETGWLGRGAADVCQPAGRLDFSQFGAVRLRRQGGVLQARTRDPRVPCRALSRSYRRPAPDGRGASASWQRRQVGGICAPGWQPWRSAPGTAAGQVRGRRQPYRRCGRRFRELRSSVGLPAGPPSAVQNERVTISVSRLATSSQHLNESRTFFHDITSFPLRKIAQYP